MATLASTLRDGGGSAAIVIPGQPRPLEITYSQLTSTVTKFQKRLAELGITPQDAVSIALVNSLEFVVAFLATTWQRAVAAPLNSAYKQDEFEFYIGDLNSTLAIVPQGSVAQASAVVRAAKKYNVALAECYWDESREEMVLDVKYDGRLKEGGTEEVHNALPDDVALVLHTSGTTGKPKAVGSVLVQ